MKRSEMRSGFYVRRATYAGATVLGAILMSAVASAAEFIKPVEMQQRSQWAREHLLAPEAKMPFSFVYDEQASDGLLAAWPKKAQSKKLDAVRTQHTITWTDPKTGLEVRCVAVEYSDYPAVEWVVYLRNTSTNNTPILSNVQAGDFMLSSRLPGQFTLYHAEGSDVHVTDFQPLQTELLANTSSSFACVGGRSSDGVLPFFNLARPDGSGAVVGIGWTGQWAASFARDAGANVKVRAGMELTHLKLHPGEKIRTPAMLLLFWAGGERMRGHNQLRRLLLDHYTPRPGGKLVDPPVASSVHGTYGLVRTNEKNTIDFINHTADNNLPVDYIWIDAGWYDVNGRSRDKPDTWVYTGTWEPDPVMYPNGMKPVADAAHNRGFKFLLWFEPERAMEGSWLWDNHPEWLLYSPNNTSRHLNLGDPDALAWAKKKFSGMVSDIGIDVYRQDFNGSPPLDHWRHGEAADRQGMTEIRYISGLYEYFDYLQAQHPNLIIDNCASGGRRLDFEMLRRAVALTRSDYIWQAIGSQCANYGLSFWTPLTGYATNSVDPYVFRSNIGSHVAVALNVNDASLWAPAKQMLNQYQSVRPLFRGDYYPLTPYSTTDAVWIGWQYDRPDIGQGLVQAFRRPNNNTSSMTLKLYGLDPAATYTVDDFDTPGTIMMSGSELLNTGLQVTIARQPGSALIKYQKQ
jgi:alpha-galactosidase